MVKSVGGSKKARGGKVSGSKKAGSAQPTERVGSSRINRSEEAERTYSAGDLNELVSRIKQTDDVRKNWVHEVKGLLRDGELLKPEAIHNAAERMLLGEF